MFHAMFLICLTMQPDVCITLDDTRGPYETKEACSERVMEMFPVAKQFGIAHFRGQPTTGRGLCRSEEEPGIKT